MRKWALEWLKSVLSGTMFTLENGCQGDLVVKLGWELYLYDIRSAPTCVKRRIEYGGG